MNKLIIAVLIALAITTGSGGYFFGFGQGKSAIQKEIQDKEEAYQKSAEAAKEVATKYLNALKFGDFKEAYNYTCPEFKNKITEAKFVARWDRVDKELTDEGTLIQDFPVTDVVVSGDMAKIRFTGVYYNPVTKEFRKPSQSEFKLVDERWCAVPLTDSY